MPSRKNNKRKINRRPSCGLVRNTSPCRTNVLASQVDARECRIYRPDRFLFGVEAWCWRLLSVYVSASLTLSCTDPSFLTTDEHRWTQIAEITADRCPLARA